MNTPSKHRGMTLVEIMIALTLFGISAGGLVSMATMMHKTAISNVADSVALHAAEGIMEQIRIMPYEEVLLKAATAPAGTTELALNRYVPAQANGTPAQIVPQEITVNGAAPVELLNVDLATTVNANYVITSSVRLPVGVRVLLREVKDANFAQGITVELIYSYRYRASDAQPSQHTLRTFIAKSVT